MEAVIIYESLTGNTRHAARVIADVLFERQVPSRIFPVDGIEADVVAAADLVILGTWTDGALIVGQRPAKRKKFARALPDLAGKPCALFCTYAITPGSTLAKFQQVAEDRGGRVVGGLAIRRDELDEGARDFIERVLAAVPA
jgi:flavodoxin